MKLYLLRHGIAEDAAPGQRDADRALTEDGIRKMRKAARGMRAVIPRLDRVLTSPLKRALQTAGIVAEAFSLEPEPCEDLALGGDPGAALQGLAGAVLLVGHEPGLSVLAGGGPGRIEFRKGALARIDLPPGRLVWLMTNRQLRDLA